MSIRTRCAEPIVQLSSRRADHPGAGRLFQFTSSPFGRVDLESVPGRRSAIDDGAGYDDEVGRHAACVSRYVDLVPARTNTGDRRSLEDLRAFLDRGGDQPDTARYGSKPVASVLMAPTASMPTSRARPLP